MHLFQSTPATSLKGKSRASDSCLMRDYVRIINFCIIIIIIILLLWCPKVMTTDCKQAILSRKLAVKTRLSLKGKSLI